MPATTILGPSEVDLEQGCLVYAFASTSSKNSVPTGSSLGQTDAKNSDYLYSRYPDFSHCSIHMLDSHLLTLGVALHSYCCDIIVVKFL